MSQVCERVGVADLLFVAPGRRASETDPSTEITVLFMDLDLDMDVDGF